MRFWCGCGCGSRVRVNISRCGFVSAGAGAAKFFGAGNAGNNINDLSKFFGADLLVRMNKDILLNFKCIDSTFCLQHTPSLPLYAAQ